LILLILILLVVNFLPQTQKNSQKFLDASFERAFVSFAIAKSLNALISVAQGTELAATPAGLGVVFAAGQALDPFNDMVERFSWVMLASTVSIGIQKIILMMSSSIIIKFLFALFALLLLIALILKRKKLFLNSLKIFLFLAILRFSIPLLALGNEALYQAFLAPSYNKATKELQQTQEETKGLIQSKEPEEGWLGKVKEVFSDTMDTLNVKKQLLSLKESLDKSFKELLVLITIFIMQTIITPLVFLYIFVKLLKLTFTMRLTPSNYVEKIENLFIKTHSKDFNV
ncbi:MAG: hypothetical protein OEW60_05870, partial [Thiovulaceae bacterium]|nr:hypothetical protein [Sulfurimonadaceae bacterium]